jgi:hypothetical protein
MDLGLGNLSTLKKFILPGSLATTASAIVPDATFSALGLGVSAAIEGMCNRSFSRKVGDVYTTEADRFNVILPRYPIETITAVNIKASDADGYLPQIISNVITRKDLASGSIWFPYMQGIHWGTIQITYTGGYWYETLEPTDAGYPSTQPTGSTALPNDLQMAWLLWASEIWNRRDKLGLGLANTPDQVFQIDKLTMPPALEHMINRYRRMQLS